MDSAHPIGLEAALHHAAAATDHVRKLALYGWLVGNWQTEVVTHDMEGRSHHRQVGDDIVQLGEIESDGQARWSFTKITANSFHWLAEASFDRGSSWRLFVEVLARRAS
jgi:hypothetical protein